MEYEYFDMFVYFLIQYVVFSESATVESVSNALNISGQPKNSNIANANGGKLNLFGMFHIFSS